MLLPDAKAIPPQASHRSRRSTRGGLTIQQPSLQSGFTLIELLVVIAIIAVLASMLLPALAKAKGHGQSIRCLNNLRQLQLCWQLYTDDHEGTMPSNRGLEAQGASAGLPGSWIVGNARLHASPSNITSGVLYPYNSSLGIYRCPSDRSTIQGSPQTPRLRSYMLDYFLNGNPVDSRVKSRETELLRPAATFAFIDVSEWMINDGAFFVSWIGFPGGDTIWGDYPTDRHNQAGTLSLADGHCELRRWLAPKPNREQYRPAAGPTDLADLRWLQARIPDP